MWNSGKPRDAIARERGDHSKQQILNRQEKHLFTNSGLLSAFCATSQSA